jgi:hypothetical protein
MRNADVGAGQGYRIVKTDIFRATLSVIRESNFSSENEMSRLTMPYNALQCSTEGSENLCDLPPPQAS